VSDDSEIAPPLVVWRHDEYGAFDQTLQRYRAALAKLETLGVKVASNSRLRNYERRLAGLPPNPREPIPLELADQLLFDLREIDEIVLIAGSFEVAPTDLEFDRLRLIAGGTDDPDKEVSARARDAQFELYLRTALRRGGGEVVLGRPDLLLTLERGSVPIEAKRPTSLARFDDRLREAVGQLQSHGLPGVAALSLDHVIRPRGGVLAVPTAGALGLAVGRLVDDFMTENLRKMVNRIRGKRLAGLMLVFRTPARALDTNLSLIGTRFHMDGAVDPEGAHGWIIEDVAAIVGRSEV
jgi:hypothetical protein